MMEVAKVVHEVVKQQESKARHHQTLLDQVVHLAEIVAMLVKESGKPCSAHQYSSVETTNNAHLNVVSLQSSFEFPSLEQTPPPVVERVVEHNESNFDPNQDLISQNNLKNNNCLKALSTQKRRQKCPEQVKLSVNVNVVFTGTLPPKLQDPGAPIISIQIDEITLDRALLDLEASVNSRTSSGDCKGCDCDLVDFLVLDCVKNTEPTIILGRSFLATAQANINCAEGTVRMRFGAQKTSLKIFSNLPTSKSNKCESPEKVNHTVENACFVSDRLTEQKDGETPDNGKKRARKRRRKGKKPLV
ncbi:hypothetical protein L1987_57719 [Smallanthus sonchifolius]|uniref:Uncharacterized protein n=1 Tax=Smallanthus sonchifolius TaxID=185202 RepID=A0ACB9DDS4_9ASTR|nr:hypothetical protein L1987_57719 [Smallanthus sonchifolius]